MRIKDLGYNRESNASVCHVIDKGNLPEWNEAKVLKKNINKKKNSIGSHIYNNTVTSTKGQGI